MALLDGLLGGSGDTSSDTTQSNSNSFEFASAPQLGVSASDVLSVLDSSSDNGGGSSDSGGSDMTSLTGVGDLGLGFAAPTAIGFDTMSDSSNSSQQDSDGGLLAGLA